MNRARHDIEPDDTTLAVRVRDAHDRDAFPVLYDRHAPQAYGLALQIVRDPQVAEDVVADAFAAFWERPHRYHPGRGAFRPWLLSVVHHRAVDAVRRSANRPVVPLDDHDRPADVDVAGSVVRSAEAAQVRAAWRRLPGEQREALGLAFWAGLTQTEVAARTNTPVGTVKSRMFAAYKRLRHELGGSP